MAQPLQSSMHLPVLLTTPSIYIPAPTPPYACDPNLNPRLFDKECNPPVNCPPLADYQLPGATIDEALSISPSGPTARKQPGTSRVRNTKSKDSKTVSTTAAEKCAAKRQKKQGCRRLTIVPGGGSTRIGPTQMVKSL
jgi:hypothetical protein